MTVLLLVFAAVLLLALLVALGSSLAHRTILSTAALSLVAGFLLGRGAAGVVPLTLRDPVVARLAGLALFLVLFSAGVRVSRADPRTTTRVPGRILTWGLPLTFVIVTLLARFLVGLGWVESLLAGAILAPTDPVLAAAVAGNKRVPDRLRDLLNRESGANAIVAPSIVLVLAIAVGAARHGLPELALGLVGGAAIGIALPRLAIWIRRTRLFAESTPFEPLHVLLVGLVVLVTSTVTHANPYMAAFAAGITIARAEVRRHETLNRFAELTANRTELAALLIIGAMISIPVLTGIGWRAWLFAALVLVAVRPVALGAALWRSGLPAREQLVVMWLGPKGFIPLVYGVLILQSGLDGAQPLFNILAAASLVSILAHSATDVLLSHYLDAGPAATTPGES